MQRTFEHNGIAFTVDVKAWPGRRFNWLFVLPDGMRGVNDVPCAFGIEAAFADAAASKAIG